MNNNPTNIYRGMFKDVNTFDTNPFPLAAVFCNVNEDGEYRFYTDKDTYVDNKVGSEKVYPGPFTNITNTDGTVVPAKAISVRF